jgi:hypothetical protein
MRPPGDCPGDIMQEINSLTRLTISPPPGGWGIFCLLLENFVPYCGAFVCFGTVFKANPHLYPGVGGGGGGGGGSVFTLTGA